MTLFPAAGYCRPGRPCRCMDASGRDLPGMRGCVYVQPCGCAVGVRCDGGEGCVSVVEWRAESARETVIRGSRC